MPPSNASIWRRDPNQSASGKPGTLHTVVLHRERIAISMDGKGCWRDNVFVERLWRSVKYEELYLNAHASVPAARASISRYIGFYNAVRPHSALGGRTPDQILRPVASRSGMINQPPVGACADGAMAYQLA